MTRATDHLAKAKEYIGKGEAFYRKAAEEIVAAMKEDTTLGYGRVAKAVGKGETWVGDLVRWHTNPRDSAPTPFKESWERSNRSAAKKMLREAQPEQIAEQFLSDPQIRRKVDEARIIAAREGMVDRHVARQDPTFIERVVRINSTLIELEAMVKGWNEPSAIPAEFSAASFDDIAEKAMRIKDTVNALRAASNDEFQEIVRNFRLVADA